MRKNLEELLVQLAALRTPVGQAINLTMTTNGAFLSRKAKMLKPSGLNRVTISLDALDDRVFKRMNDVDFPVVKVLEGIEATLTAGITNIKVNMVAKRWVNDHEALAVSQHGSAGKQPKSSNRTDSSRSYIDLTAPSEMK